MKKTTTIVAAALMAAFTCVATMLLKFPTPGVGYIHLGDGIVLLCGLLLGPGYGALAAGIGSALADLFGGYAIFAPGTFAIKAVTAMIVGALHVKLAAHTRTGDRSRRLILICGIPAELFMTAGYFAYQILILALTGDGFSGLGLSTAAVASAADIPFNLLQGAVGIAVSTVLYPILAGIPLLRGDK